MKKIGALVLVVVFAIFGGIFAVTHIKVVDAGKVGVVYSANGGVKDELYRQGWHFVPPMHKVKEFTVGNEQLVLSKDKREGSEGDDSFKVATSDDASIGLSFQMSYRFIEENVADTYKKFKGMSGEDIVNNRVKTVIKSKISEVTTNYSMMDIYSGNRSEINQKITDYLNKDFSKKYGIEVLDASIIDVHLDKKLKQAVENRVQALQKKQQAQVEQETVKVENETKLLEAKNNAEIEKTKAEAEATANQTIAKSITKELIEMKLAEARLEHGWVTTQGAGAVVTNGDK